MRNSGPHRTYHTMKELKREKMVPSSSQLCQDEVNSAIQQIQQETNTPVTNGILDILPLSTSF